MKLTMHPMVWSPERVEIDFAPESVIQYFVNLPDREDAYLRKIGDIWRIQTDEERGWRGDYASAEEALAALEKKSVVLCLVGLLPIKRLLSQPIR